MKVLVTGGAGFIGSHLSEFLIGRGDTVVGLDDLSTGSARNLATLRYSPRFWFVRGSVLERKLVDALVEDTDAVVHLASAVGVKLIVDEPLQSLITMIHGTEAVLEAARRHRRRVIVASTSEVYGKNGGVLREDSDRLLGPTTVPRWTYATAKAIDEYLAFGYWQDHRVPTVVVRFFNTVGPRQSGAYGMVLPRFAACALLGQDLVVHGDGSQSRCFCHVGDTVRAVAALLDEPAAVGKVFNIASTSEVTILELARRVLRITGSASSIRLAPHREEYGDHFEDIGRRVPDIGRIQALTGWTPQWSLDDSIRDIVTAARQAGPARLLAGAA